MHHYGEDAVRADISAVGFTIIVKNHVTGAEITVTGPLQGVYEDASKKMDQGGAEHLGRELAHFARNILR